MKNILLIGVGGTGSAAVDIFYKKKNELGSQTGNKVTALVFDTDAGDLKKISDAKTVSLADPASVGTICDRFGKEFLKEWFPCDDKAIRAQEMIRGASQWRKKSYLAFLNLMNKPLTRQTFISALEGMVADPGASCEIYVIASVAGGTGSGSFIPIALYAKRYLRKNLGKDPIVNAMIALPDIFADKQTPENRIKVYSNAYAILRELNAINLVARGYNAGRTAEKKAPIKFRIGHPDEPSVGVLFDASDKQFWTPEASPFTQIFLLDRIPGLNSVEAHNIVLANSLYTMLCTEIGSAFDSEFSNHELLRSQCNGSNAIYAGISTSQIRFPQESVLDYLAHKKTLEACNNEWLILHNSVERSIKEKEREAKAMGASYTMRDGEYAAILLEELANAEENDCEPICALVARNLESVDKDGNKIRKEEPINNYVRALEKYITSKIPAYSAEELTDIEKATKMKVGKPSNEQVIKAAQDMYANILQRYFVRCVETIKKSAMNTTDSIFTLDKKKLEFVGKQVPLVDTLLKKDGKFLHPVSCMIRLCLLRKALLGMGIEKLEKWPAMSKRDLDSVEIEENLLAVEDVSAGKSAYAKMGGERFQNLMRSPKGYKGEKSNVSADFTQLQEDGKAILANIYKAATQQFLAIVLRNLAASVDMLINKYRSFFNRFEKEKEDLEDSTRTAKRKDSLDIDSVINVYSSEQDKENIFKYISEEAGPSTPAEQADADDVVGNGVFTTVYSSASAVFSGESWNDKDSSAYRSIFNGMIKAYKNSIQKSEEYEAIASYNVVEAMVASCGENASEKDIADSLRGKFAVAQDLAKPSLRIDTSENLTELVQPSEIMVFMISLATGKYIKKHAERFGITPPADQTKESSVIKACAEAFIHKYSGNTSARVSIVSSIPDQVLYCTGEIMDITPLRIAKFDELGEDNIYFKNYATAIANYKKYGTDMWNPHLGNNLYKRGYLPYMNEEKETECDRQMVKALLFAFFKKNIVFADGVGESKNRYFFEWNGKKITDPEGKWIGRNNIAQLLAWMRNEDELTEIWSRQFDLEIQREMNMLPSIASDSPTEISALEKALTNTPFMKMLTECLFEDTSGKMSSKKPRLSDGKIIMADRCGPTVLEFAYMIKTSEEIGRDCDDAERILSVVYEVFEEMCAYRTNPNNTPDRFIQVYKQQLGNAFESLATSDVVCAAGKECKAHFRQMTAWLNQAGFFNTISDDMPMDETGKVCINVAFDFERSTSTNDVKRLLNYISGDKKQALAPAPEKKVEETVVEEVEEVEEIVDTETTEVETDAE